MIRTRKILGVVTIVALLVSSVSFMAQPGQAIMESGSMQAYHQRFHKADIHDPDINSVAASQDLSGHYA